ncbi:MAG: Stp1/IreP family PP2C-type Ser/Thr phosphatase [Clostridia bacterium]|nr:Stp1/IreP family PP2C-type Ser/Thr phosphatase [Clostridia bacterium]
MRISSATSVGKIRAVNEDSFFVSELDSSGALLAIVADGMGGHNAGEVASAEAVKMIKDGVVSSDSDTKDMLLEAIECANNAIYKMSVKSPQLHGMGTTATACVISENTVTAAQVGDSRLYLIKDNSITQITKDHSLVEMLIESGSITKEDARQHPQKNVITRAIGTNSSVETDIYEFTVEPEDIILLCSDGLVNMVEDEKILSLITESKDFENLADKLVCEAENAGGHDNITVILIKF